MSINSLKTLITNPTFKTLAYIQAALDDSDDVLRATPMTRSPYHLLALLMMWLLVSQESKSNIIKRINEYQRAHLESSKPLTIVDLDTFTSQLGWEQLVSELNISSSSFFKLTLPQNVILQLQAIGAKAHIPQDFLTRSLQAGAPQEIIVTTTICQQFKWAETFDDYFQNWYVPQSTFQLSNDFKSLLLKMKAELSPTEQEQSVKQIGAFCITANRKKTFSEKPVSDSYGVRILHHDSSELAAQIPKNTKINQGLYSAFEGATLKGDVPITAVQVELEGSSYFNQNGVGVEQTQRVFMDGCAMLQRQQQEQEYIHFDIEVSEVHALFVDSLIAIHFSEPCESELTALSLAAENPFISLMGALIDKHETPYKEDSHHHASNPNIKEIIKIYPDRMTHRAVLDTAFANKEAQKKLGGFFVKKDDKTSKRVASSHCCVM